MKEIEDFEFYKLLLTHHEHGARIVSLLSIRCVSYLARQGSMLHSWSLGLGLTFSG